METLKKEKVRASFFLTGNCLRMKEHEQVIRRIVTGEHYIGGHSDRHLLYASWEDRNRSLVTPDSLIMDLENNLRELERLGVRPQEAGYFLPPYEWYNEEQVKILRAQGQQVVNFTPGIRMAADYTTPDMPNYRSSRELIDQLWEFEKEHTLQGAIILIHPGTQEKRSDKLYLHIGEIIRTIRGKGYDFARIDE